MIYCQAAALRFQDFRNQLSQELDTQSPSCCCWMMVDDGIHTTLKKQEIQMQEIVTCWYGWSYTRFFLYFTLDFFFLPKTLEMWCKWTYRVIATGLILQFLRSMLLLMLVNHCSCFHNSPWEKFWHLNRTQGADIKNRPCQSCITPLEGYSTFINFEMNTKNVLCSVWTKSM